ncbi:hypothetical protein [Nonomuraea sp. JJY05]|uniref:hypothetical protein n=1 Tax=Nonomuraea sp. JJY05 TaxID=3350255 RepID=UPI00373EF7BF
MTMGFAASGRIAFGTDSTTAVINRILDMEPEISGPAGTLLELVTAALSKDPAKRPSVCDLVARLPSPAAPPSLAVLTSLTSPPSLVVLTSPAVLPRRVCCPRPRVLPRPGAAVR